MRVVVLGGGYAGLTLAKRLEDRLEDDVDLVLVDETGTHLIQHELHRVVRRPALADKLQFSLKNVLSRTTVRRARVEHVDAEHKIVSLSDDHVEYDICAVCLGAQTAFYGLPGVAEHATPLKRIEDTKAIRREFLDLDDSDRVVVGGAGLSGIQVAGELAALGDARGHSPQITILEQKSTVAPGFEDRFQRAVEEALSDLGVEVRTETTVKRADDEAITFADGTVFEYGQFVWTGGIRGPDAFGGERPHVRSNLQVEPETFVLGDAGRVVDGDGETVPATAQAAVKAAKVTTRNIEAIIEHDESSVFEPRLEQFVFEPSGWLVSVGDATVAQVGPRVLTGRPAKVMKATVGARYLTGIGAVENALDVVYEELGFAE